MAAIQVIPTRMELKKLKTRLSTARRGHKLLKDKCDELMKQFLDVIRQNKVLRESVEEGLRKVHGSFTVAAAMTSPDFMREALMLPRAESSLDVGYQNVMSVTVPTFRFELNGTNGYNYGMAYTSGELDTAVRELSELTESLVKLAEAEKTAQLLAAEIERTRRRVNALEYTLIPELTEGIRTITMKLGENERGNLTRLMKLKDMMLSRETAQASDPADL